MAKGEGDALGSDHMILSSRHFCKNPFFTPGFARAQRYCSYLALIQCFLKSGLRSLPSPSSVNHFPLCLFPLGPTSRCLIRAFSGFLLKPADPCQRDSSSAPCSLACILLGELLLPPSEVELFGLPPRAPSVHMALFAFRKGHIFFKTSYFHLWGSHYGRCNVYSVSGTHLSVDLCPQNSL